MASLAALCSYNASAVTITIGESFDPSVVAALFDGAGLPAFVWKIEGDSLCLAATNRAADQLAGIEGRAFAGREFREVLPRLAPAVPGVLSQAAASGVAIDLGVLTVNGRDCHTKAVPTSPTSVALVVSSSSDSVTRAMLQAMPDMMFRIRRDGTYVGFMGPPEAPLVRPYDFIGKRVSDVLPAGVVAGVQEAIEHAITDREVATATYELDYPEGRRVFEARVAAIDDEEVIAVVRDITAHFRRNEELDAAVISRTADLESANAALQRLSRRVIMAEEEERRAIAREVHDHAAQLITGLQMAVEACGREVPEAAAHTHRIEAIVGDLAGQFRDLALGLRPPLLDDEGLLPALRAHVDRFSASTGIGIELDATALPRFERYLERTAFRITQEALTNAVRARARKIKVRLTLSGDELQIEVVDDGRGFDPARVDPTRSSGLSGMRERALLAGGNIHISSPSSRGVCVCVVLPIAFSP